MDQPHDSVWCKILPTIDQCLHRVFTKCRSVFFLWYSALFVLAFVTIESLKNYIRVRSWRYDDHNLVNKLGKLHKKSISPHIREKFDNIEKAGSIVTRSFRDIPPDGDLSLFGAIRPEAYVSCTFMETVEKKSDCMRQVYVMLSRTKQNKNVLLG